MKRLLPFVIIIVVLAGALGAYFYMKRAALNTSAIPPATAPGSSPAAAAVAANASPGAQPPHFRGSENAPLTLEEFGDFECPPCGLLFPVLKGIEDEYGPRLRVIFREYPLTPNHPHALAAAQAAEAAGLQGRFFEMHDMIYQNQTTWKDLFDVRPVFEGYAKQIGLDVERWKRDQTGDAVDQRIFLDGNRAHSLGVKGTPTVFLNGVEVPFEQLTPEGLRAAINKALANPNH
ncbi:MAG: formate/nitrite transporter [Acidobacteria bacterium]|nr:formate/nitrite transporter [Acidobacteriota bacterium]